jgi:hypothetical protein
MTSRWTGCETKNWKAVSQSACFFCLFECAALSPWARLSSACCFQRLPVGGRLVPRCTRAVALMKKQHARAGLGGGEVRFLEDDAVGRLNITDARRGQ